MKKHDFRYFFREGISNMFSHGFMSFAAVGITIACLLIMGTFSLVALNADANLRTLRQQSEILAFVDESYSNEQARALQGQIEAVENVSSVTFVSREQALQDFKEEYSDDGYTDLLVGFEASELRDRYRVRITDLELMQKTAQALEAVPGIADVRANEDLSKGFLTISHIATIVCVTLIAILLAVSLFIMSNTIKLTTFDRKDEIAIMKMVGATDGFIRWPFVYEGLLLGLFSAVIAFFLQWGLYASIAASIGVSDTLSLINIVPFSNFWIPMLLIFIAVGLLVGIVGSLMAIRKFLRV